ncbi:hypothetical protein [Pseudomonas lundensis]|nr:hypothetical protein [Pseudomonas lundensis]
MSIRKAVSLAEKALDLSWDGALPVDPQEIAEDLLIKNFSASGDDSLPVVVRGRSSDFLDGVSG